ncbi:MAG: hypothetical protein AAGC46_12735 [Solirubrobacteraceae bacterium]|nr:hypothetical protein [Patulibacter sp.]
MRAIADWVWRKPVFCKLSREHVPDPEDLFRAEAYCLRCGRTYDDGVAQVHRQHRIIARARPARRRRGQQVAWRGRRASDA